MGNLKLKSNTIYLFNNSIANNIYSGAFYELLTKLKLKGDYLNSKYYSQGKIVDFINEQIIEQKISKDDFDKFLPSQLAFGKHRQVFYYKFRKGYDNSCETICDVLSKRFGISDLEYNKLSTTYYSRIDGENEDLAYIKVFKRDKEKIYKLRLIMVKKVKYQAKVGEGYVPKFENSYFPVDIDFEKQTLIIKVATKDYIKIPDYKGTNLGLKYAESFLKLFNLRLVQDKTGNQAVLFNMCNKLLDKVVTEISKLGMESLDKNISDLKDTVETTMTKKLKLSGVNKEAFKDLSVQIRNCIENTILPLILIDNKNIDGLISYIKFKDKTAVKAVLKTRKRAESLLDSESYLNLRKTVKDSKYVQKIRVIWNEKDISLYYDASRDECVELHFYRKLFKEDLEYAISKFEEYR